MTKMRDLEGGCSCGNIRYRMKVNPLIVHACHCRQCQRITGSAFVMNALIEKTQVETLSGELSNFHIPGTYHTVFFCPECATYLWSEYKSGRFDNCWFIRVGTLDEPDQLPPDVHIFTESKQRWVNIPKDTPSFEKFYSVKQTWTQSSIERMEDYWNSASVTI